MSVRHATENLSREAVIRHSMITGFVDVLITFTAMIVTNSSVVLADFCKTFLEFVGVFLSWWAIRRIARGSHGRFDYGLGKMENLVSLGVAALMTICLLIIIAGAVHNFLHPVHISGWGVKISMTAQLVYVVINSTVAIRNRKAAREANSPLLESQARLHFTRAFANAFILLALTSSILLSEYGWSRYIDPIASLVIASSILMAAMGIFSTSVSQLLDRTIEESDQFAILRVLTSHFDDFEFLHGVRSRRAGSHVFIDILLEFDPEKQVGEVQAVIDELVREIQEKVKNSQVTIGLSTGPVSGSILA